MRGNLSWVPSVPLSVPQCLPPSNSSPGQPVEGVTLTGPGPVWGYLTIAHALHGRVPRLLYAAPNAPELVIFSHGA